MDLLPIIWFIAIAVLWTGYFVLEGFDFGVGALLPVLGRGADADADRRVMINAIGPVWDGNEVWLLTAVGATFAAFPAWYAGLLSSFYLPLLLVLLALIVRGVAFEYRGKLTPSSTGPADPRTIATWRARWDAAIVAGSVVPAFIWGALFATVLRGLEFTPEGKVVAGPLDIAHPVGLLGGLTTLALFALHGAVFLALKTDGPIRTRARSTALFIAPVATLLLGGLLAWIQLARGNAWTGAVSVVAVLAVGAAALTISRRREGWAFVATAVAIVGMAVAVFGSLFPYALPAAGDTGGLTITEAASGPYTLTMMTWVAVVFLPVVLAYQAWSYWVFRRRITRELVTAERVGERVTVG